MKKKLPNIALPDYSLKSILEVIFDQTLTKMLNYELNELFFEQLGIRKPNFFLGAAKETPSKTIGDIISKIDVQI
jgi:hypothetical protein